MCWSKQDDAATSELASTYARTTAMLRKLDLSPVPAARAQAAWVRARDATCAFEYKLYLPGTIAPQLGIECDFRMTRARTKRLTALQDSLQANGSVPVAQAVSAAADAELKRVYVLYLARLTAAQRSDLASAERAWIAYRDTACAIEGGRCFTELTRERTAELERSWVGEVFW
jgi:uncharacterized protein YecT (DUF1311 family)